MNKTPEKQELKVNELKKQDLKVNELKKQELNVDEYIKIMKKLQSLSEEAQRDINSNMKILPKSKEAYLDVNKIFEKYNKQKIEAMQKHVNDLRDIVKKEPSVQGALHEAESNLEKLKKEEKSLEAKKSKLQRELNASGVRVSYFDDIMNDKITQIDEMIKESIKIQKSQNKEKDYKKILDNGNKVREISSYFVNVLDELQRALNKIEKPSDLKQNSDTKETFFNKLVKNIPSMPSMPSMSSMPSMHYLFKRKQVNTSKPQASQQVAVRSSLTAKAQNKGVDNPGVKASQNNRARNKNGNNSM